MARMSLAQKTAVGGFGPATISSGFEWPLEDEAALERDSITTECLAVRGQTLGGAVVYAGDAADQPDAAMAKAEQVFHGVARRCAIVE